MYARTDRASRHNVKGSKVEGLLMCRDESS